MPDIYITFDYELFFRESGTPAACLFEPTDDLQHILRHANMKATFFVDVLYYNRLCDLTATEGDATRMREQLIALAQEGHALGLHLHPHWQDASFEGPGWRFSSYDHYRLDSLPQREITALFVEGTEQLNQIYRMAGRTNRVDAFRAGGWCIQPFSKLAEGFRKAGIRIDSSVGHGMHSNSTHHAFDFRNAPSTDIYRFANDPATAETHGEFWELPLTTFRPGLGHKVTREIQRRMHPEAYRMSGDGSGLRYTPSPATLLGDAITSSPRFVSLDGEPADLFVKEIQELMQYHIVVCGHTKCYSSAMAECLHRVARIPGCRFPAISEQHLLQSTHQAGDAR